MSRVLSGIQPTGNIHIGNYLGAIKQWINLQDIHECLFCVVDLHAITVAQNASELSDNIRKTAATYIACGVDINKSSIFDQSRVRQHTELAWLLACNTPLGWLNRMTQFKEKAGKKREQASLGLYSYPVLMAADILLYQATHVPVGDDQKQHLELARDIAQSFNSHYDDDIFTIPEPLIVGDATRVMSLRDGTKKMSKSDISAGSRINITDSADDIIKKIKKAKSDDYEFIGLSEERPEASNLLKIYASLSGKELSSVASQFATTGFSQFKKELADLCVAEITPIADKINYLMQDKAEIDRLLSVGATKASEIAEFNMQIIRSKIGFIS